MKILKISFPVFFIFVLLTAGTLDADCIVLFCKPSASFKIFRQIHLRDMTRLVFGPLNLMNENELSEQELQEYNDALIIPSPARTDSKSLSFRRGYKEWYF